MHRPTLLLLCSVLWLLGATGAQTLEDARRLARTDRPAARALVEELVGAGDADPFVDWDARLWLASDRERALQDPAGAVALTGPLWERVLEDDVPGEGRAVRRLEARTAEVHSRALAALGQTDASRAVEQALKARDRARTGTPSSPLQPGPAAKPLDRARQASIARTRERLGRLSWLGLLAFAVLALPPAVQSVRREPRPTPVGSFLVAGFALIAGAFGRFWEPGAGAAAWWMALGFAGVHLVSAFALLGTPAGPRQWAVRGGAVWATAAVCFLALRATGTLGWVTL